MLVRTLIAGSWILSALVGTNLSAQARPIPEQDIARVKIELDSTVDRMSGRWTIGTKWFNRRGLDDLTDDLDGNPSTMSLAPSSTTLLSLAIIGGGNGGRIVGAYFRYEGSGWVFLTGRMMLLVDDSLRFELAGQDMPARSEIGTCTDVSCHVKEEAVFVVPDSILGAMASAHSVEVRILGERRNLDRRFKKQHLALARALWARRSDR